MVNIFLDLDRTTIYSYHRFTPKSELMVELFADTDEREEDGMLRRLRQRVLRSKLV